MSFLFIKGNNSSSFLLFVVLYHPARRCLKKCFAHSEFLPLVRVS